MTHGFHLAQINIGRARGSIDDPVMAEFVAQLPTINALAEGAPGFVWRLQTAEGNATSIQAYDDPRIIINMSVWTDLASLRDYVYRSPHAAVMRRRREWFERMDVYLALWWVPIGHTPTIEEAVERLAWLEAHGPSPRAFTMAQAYDPSGAPVGRGSAEAPDVCLA